MNNNYSSYLQLFVPSFERMNERSNKVINNTFEGTFEGTYEPNRACNNNISDCTLVILPHSLEYSISITSPMPTNAEYANYQTIRPPTGGIALLDEGYERKT